MKVLAEIMKKSKPKQLVVGYQKKKNNKSTNCIYQDGPCKCNSSCREECEGCSCLTCPVHNRPPHYE